MENKNIIWLAFMLAHAIHHPPCPIDGTFHEPLKLKAFPFILNFSNVYIIVRLAAKPTFILIDGIELFR